MVALVYENLAGHSFVECGGSLISHNVVLTAAHCIKTGLKSVKLGHGNLMSEDVIEVDVALSITHPNWNRKINDIALVMLTERVEFNDNVNPISLPRDYSEDSLANGVTFEKLVVSGWGKTSYDQDMWTKFNGVYARTSQLKKLQQSYVRTDECLETSPHKRHYSRLLARLPTIPLICTKGTFGTSDSCENDSGGPLMGITASNHVEIIGVLSHGSRKCDNSQPTIYTRVSKFLPWINDLVNSAQLLSVLNPK